MNYLRVKNVDHVRQWRNQHFLASLTHCGGYPTQITLPQSDYMNIQSSQEDLYINTSVLSLDTTLSPVIRRTSGVPTPPKKLINYPPVIPKYSKQTSEYMVMGGGDYIDLDDYDEPPTSADYVQFDGIAKQR